MTALVLIGLVVLVALYLVWSRVSTARSERRSMENYEHSLHVLGDVAKRTDAPARIRPFSPHEVPRGDIRAAIPAETVRPEEEGITSIFRAEANTVPPEVQAPPEEETTAEPAPGQAMIGQGLVRFEDDSDAYDRAIEEAERETRVAGSDRYRFGDDDLVGSGVAAGAISSDGGSGRSGRRGSVYRDGVGAGWSQMGKVAAVAIILAGVALGALRLASGGSRPPSSPPTTQPHHPNGGGGTTGSTTPPSSTPTTAPDTLIPVSTSPTDVAFVAPKGSYTVSLQDTDGSCWVGIQQTSGGPYVFQETLYSGQSATYTASGPLVIRIGAPKYLGVKVNGVPARLPGFVQPYDVTFNPATQPSTA